CCRLADFGGFGFARFFGCEALSFRIEERWLANDGAYFVTAVLHGHFELNFGAGFEVGGIELRKREIFFQSWRESTARSFADKLAAIVIDRNGSAPGGRADLRRQPEAAVEGLGFIPV